MKEVEKRMKILEKKREMNGYKRSNGHMLELFRKEEVERNE
jgi:hypothetical protein